MGDLYIVQEYSLLLKPHPLKEKSGGRPVVMVPLVLFSDDTSGNKSEKWHKFDSWSFVLGGLPRHENSKISNLHFCCCSDIVSAMDMSGEIAIKFRIFTSVAVPMSYQLWICQEK